ncbi:MAG: rod shape-determining protein MreC [Chlamydiota bacterium]
MRKNRYPYYLILIVVVGALLSFPGQFSKDLRFWTVERLALLWKPLEKYQHSSFKGWSWLFKSQNESYSKFHDENQRLRLENSLLHEELVNAKQFFNDERFLQYQIARLEELRSARGRGAASRHYKALLELLDYQIEALPARVVYRDPSSWSSSVWIGLGKEDNLSGKVLIGKDSPVVMGASLVGVVDYVGQHQSRVRLITDSGLNPAVRAVRGDLQKSWLTEQIEVILQELQEKNSFLDDSDQTLLVDILERWQHNLAPEGGTHYLAKGIVQGGSSPLWRSAGQELKGVGFNYDYSDEYGSARDLRSGRPFNNLVSGEAVPIIQQGDLLVTTGLDGVFPPGLRVAKVAKVYPLQEGSYSYDLKAVPTATNLNNLSLVYVLPPQRCEN